jgi:hypothetical protein
MLDIVAANQDQAAAAIHGRRVDDGEAWLASTSGGGAEARAGEAAKRESGERDERKNDGEREDELRV